MMRLVLATLTLVGGGLVSSSCGSATGKSASMVQRCESLAAKLEARGAPALQPPPFTTCISSLRTELTHCSPQACATIEHALEVLEHERARAAAPPRTLDDNRCTGNPLAPGCGGQP
jgi:hypothetical protein